MRKATVTIRPFRMVKSIVLLTALVIIGAQAGTVEAVLALICGIELGITAD